MHVHCTISLCITYGLSVEDRGICHLYDFLTCIMNRQIVLLMKVLFSVSIFNCLVPYFMREAPKGSHRKCTQHLLLQNFFCFSSKTKFLCQAADWTNWMSGEKAFLATTDWQNSFAVFWLKIWNLWYIWSYILRFKSEYESVTMW